MRAAAPPAVKPSKVAKGAVPMRAAVMAKPQASQLPPRFAEPRPVLATAQARLTRRPGLLDEDDESSGGHNLLLGPRNVRPYLERKGEQYMGKEQLAHFRAILNSWKRDLMEEVDRTMTHMKDEAANPPDPNDRATLESEFALELRTRDRERKLIRKIDEAMSRIDDGTYGYCIETGEPIGVKRLEARPVATLCIEAQERRERREKQYGDRDDWYR
jgi:DnaK suppressor protein